MIRKAANRLLWAAAKRLPNGEEALRAHVCRMNERDGTNLDKRGAEEFGSTKLLTDEQLGELAEKFRYAAGLPAPTRRPNGPRGGRYRRPSPEAGATVTHFATIAEKDYVCFLFEKLSFAPEKREVFVHRQTKGTGLVTHRACCAVVEPLERMLRARGFRLVEQDRLKQWLPPLPAKAGDGDA